METFWRHFEDILETVWLIPKNPARHEEDTFKINLTTTTPKRRDTRMITEDELAQTLTQAPAPPFAHATFFLGGGAQILGGVHCLSRPG